jgi:hypothetical protein
VCSVEGIELLSWKFRGSQDIGRGQIIANANLLEVSLLKGLSTRWARNRSTDAIEAIVDKLSMAFGPRCLDRRDSVQEWRSGVAVSKGFREINGREMVGVMNVSLNCVRAELDHTGKGALSGGIVSRQGKEAFVVKDLMLGKVEK